MHRNEITDKQYFIIEKFIPGTEKCVGVTAKDNRLFINAVLWILKTGAPWRDLPERFGKWKTVHTRYSRWSKKGIMKKILDELNKSDESDKGEDTKRMNLMIDSTIIRAHQHATGMKDQEIGKSVGGNSTKIHCIMSGDLSFIDITLSRGNQYDIVQAENLIEGKSCDSLIADKAYRNASSG